VTELERNTYTGPKFLIISYFANIDALAASHHIDDKLLRLQQEGVEFHLLSSPCCDRSGDFSHTRVPSLAPSGIRYEIRYLLRRKAADKIWRKLLELLLLIPVYPFYFMEKIFIRLDSTWSWFFSSSIAAIILTVRHKPGIIYSTGGPLSAHIAAMIASLATKIPYIAEFQDPPVNKYAAPGIIERFFSRKVEKLIFKTAKRVIFLTRKAAESAAIRNAGLAPILTIYPGAPTLAIAQPAGKDKAFIVAHYGSLGGSRNMKYIFKALTELAQDIAGFSETFHLHLYGYISRQVKKEIAQYEYKQMLFLPGKVKKQQALQSMSNADVLLLIQNTDDISFETIPSKVYEYMHTGAPVLALVYRNPELQDMLERRGHEVVQADNERAIAMAIRKYMTQWELKSLPRFSPSPYTIEKAVKKLLLEAKDVAKLQNAKNILIINLKYIGDTIWMYPLISNLKLNLPDSRISVLVNENTEPFLKLMPELAEVISLKRKEIKSSGGAWKFLQLIKDIRKRRFDTVIILSNSDRPTIIGFASGARTIIGFFSDSWWRHHLLTKKLLWDSHRNPHMIQCHLQVLTDNGLYIYDKSLSINVPDGIVRSLQKRFSILGTGNRKAVVVHPGARTKFRQWGPENFAAVINALSPDYRIFLLGGPEEKDVVQEIAGKLNKAPDIVSTSFSLLEFAALCTFCTLFIGNDSAPIHIAAGVGTFVIGMYGPTYSEQCGPWTDRKALFDISSLPCRSCKQEVCHTVPYKACLSEIKPESVIKKAREILAQEGGQARSA
jgi:predicted lipopolysaccharide heptosyltransferase III